MYDVLEKISSLEVSTSNILATIIKVEGSAYRKEGAMMVIGGDGSKVGLLSAGCLEEDLIERVQSMNLITPITIPYDLSSEDDLSWGQGAGCNGTLYVLLEPITKTFHAHLLALKAYLEKGYAVQLVRRIDSQNAVTDYQFIVGNSVSFGEWSCESLDYELERLTQKLGTRPNRLISVCSNATQLYIQTFQPQSRFILFGGGADAIPLTKIAKAAGFSLTVTDWRPALCNRSTFPDANQIVIGTPERIAEQLRLTEYDTIILLSHVFQKDRAFLKAIQDQLPFYIGILGSKDRTKRLLSGLKVKSPIYSPVGLTIGAEGPEEIAISIIAQLIQLKRKPMIHTPYSHMAKIE